MSRRGRVAGAKVEPIGEIWVAFSPATGETTLLNDETAAILEVLETGPASTQAVAAVLAGDSGIPAVELVATLDAAWPHLIEAGLVRTVPDVASA